MEKVLNNDQNKLSQEMENKKAENQENIESELESDDVDDDSQEDENNDSENNDEEEEKIESSQQSKNVQSNKVQEKQMKEQVQNKELVNYEISCQDYKWFQMFMKEIVGVDQEGQFLKTMKKIKFKGELSRDQEKAYQEMVNQDLLENKQIKIEIVDVNNKYVVEFEGNMRYYLEQIEALYLKPQGSLIEYRILQNSLEITNSGLSIQQYQDLYNSIKQIQSEMKSERITLGDLQSQSSLFDIKIFCESLAGSRFLKKIKEECKIEFFCISYLRSSDSSNRNLRNGSSESETDLEFNGSNQTISKSQSAYLFGYIKEGLIKAKSLIQEFDIRNMTLPFLTEEEKKKKLKIQQRSEIQIQNLIKDKRQLFLENLKDQFNADLEKHFLSVLEVSQTESENIKYRINGNKKIVEQFIKFWETRIKDSLHDQQFVIKVDGDGFLENRIKSDIKSLIESTEKLKNIDIKNKFKIRISDKIVDFVFMSKKDQIPEEIAQIRNKVIRIVSLKKVKRTFNSVLVNDLQKMFLKNIGPICEMKGLGKEIELIGTEEEINEGLKVMENFKNQNIESKHTFQFASEQIKKIFLAQYKDEIIQEFQSLKIPYQSEKSSILNYSIPIFFDQNLKDSLEKKQEKIELSITHKAFTCTKEQFLMISDKKLTIIEKIEDKFGIEVIVDQNELRSLGYQANNFSITSNGFKNLQIFESECSFVQLTLIEGEISKITLDQILVNLTPTADYIDNYTQQIVKLTGAGQSVIKSINKYNEDKNTSKKKQKDLENYQYSYVQSNSFATQKIVFSLTNQENNIIPDNIQRFINEDQQNRNVGLVLPSKQIQQEDQFLSYLLQSIHSMQQIHQKNIESNSKNSQSSEFTFQKNILLFCEEDQFERVKQKLTMNKSSKLNQKEGSDPLSQQEFIVQVDDDTLPPLPGDIQINFNKLFFQTPEISSKDTFYGMIPPLSSKGKFVKVPINPQKKSFSWNNRSFALDSVKGKLKKELNMAVERAAELKLTSICSYINKEAEFEFELLQINPKKCRVKYVLELGQRRNLSLIKPKSSQVSNWIYVVRGTKDGIDKAENEIKNMFNPLDLNLWDFEYTSKNPLMKNIKKLGTDQKQSNIFSDFNKVFEENGFILKKLEFIQSIPLDQKYKKQIEILTQKLGKVPQIQNSLFYLPPKGIKIQEDILSCTEFGLDVRIHCDPNSSLNTNAIILSSSPAFPELTQNEIMDASQISRDEEEEDEDHVSGMQCLICEVIIGNSFQFNPETMKEIKRPKKDNNQLFYDSFVYSTHSDDEFKIGIFDQNRIYPKFIATFSPKKEESSFLSSRNTD